MERIYQHKLHLNWTLLKMEVDISRAALRDWYDDAQTQRFSHFHRSGDGISNYGYSPDAAFRNFMFDNVTVNGLVILSNSTGVVEYYRRNVLHGRNAFLVVAGGFTEFREAMTRKLYWEINDIVLGSPPVTPMGKPEGQAAPRIFFRPKRTRRSRIEPGIRQA